MLAKKTINGDRVSLILLITQQRPLLENHVWIISIESTSVKDAGDLPLILHWKTIKKEDEFNETRVSVMNDG